MKNSIASIFGLVLILLSTTASADRAFQVVNMMPGPDTVADPSMAQGAAWLRRTKDRIDGRVMVRTDLANTAYTIWWIAFNNPEACAMVPPDGCDLLDLILNKNAVGGAVFNASGAISANAGINSAASITDVAPEGVINVDIELVAGEGSDKGHAPLPPIPAEFCPGCVFLDLNGVLRKNNGCGAEIHIDVNQHDEFDEDWATELTQPEGDTHRFAVFHAVDCRRGKNNN